jgi:hypothetical protein
MTSRLPDSQASGLTLTPGQVSPLYQTTIGQSYWAWATIAMSLYTAFESHSPMWLSTLNDAGRLTVAWVSQPPFPKTERLRSSREPSSALERQVDTIQRNEVFWYLFWLFLLLECLPRVLYTHGGGTRHQASNTVSLRTCTSIPGNRSRTGKSEPQYHASSPSSRCK